MQGSNADQLRRARRIACWGGIGIIAIGFAVLIPLKWQGLLPAEMTWVKVVLGPILLTGLLPLGFIDGGQERVAVVLTMDVVCSYCGAP
jgi:hypothetical protein